MYTHLQNQNTLTTTTKSTIDQPSEQKKPKIISTRTKPSKAKTGKQN